MPFKKADPNINRGGRPKRPTTVRSKLRKLEKILEGITDEAIAVTMAVMKTAGKPETKLKAAVWILDSYVTVHSKAVEEEMRRNPDGETGDDDEDTTPVTESPKPALSLTMIKKSEINA